nr:hypothetical protein [Tanacetum cinerariifolium]
MFQRIGSTTLEKVCLPKSFNIDNNTSALVCTRITKKLKASYSLTSAAAQSSSAVASLCISSGNLSSLAVGSCSDSGKSSLAAVKLRKGASFCASNVLRQQQRYLIPSRQGIRKVKCRHIILLPLGKNLMVKRLLPVDTRNNFYIEFLCFLPVGYDVELVVPSFLWPKLLTADTNYVELVDARANVHMIDLKTFLVNFYTKDGDEVDYVVTKDHQMKCVVVGCHDPRMYQPIPHKMLLNSKVNRDRKCFEWERLCDTAKFSAAKAIIISADESRGSFVGKVINGVVADTETKSISIAFHFHQMHGGYRNVWINAIGCIIAQRRVDMGSMGDGSNQTSFTFPYVSIDFFVDRGVSFKGNGFVVEESASFLEEAIATPFAVETKGSSV